MNPLDAFSPDYAAARERYREAADALGWSRETIPLSDYGAGEIGAAGEELTIDVATSLATVDRGAATSNQPRRTVVVTSGLHGVEGFFGSAVQLAWMQRRAVARGLASEPPDAAAEENDPRTTVDCLFLHALNPFGFSHRRRWDDGNVDPNRNFLSDDETYAGVPEKYAALDALLNPPRPPSRFDPFLLKAFVQVARHGLPALKQAIATGQYDYPRGLFFGGKAPSPTMRALETHLPSAIAGSSHVVHLDFHTGLGKFADCRLLLDSPLASGQRDRLVRSFGEDAFEENDPHGTAYAARGGFGTWLVGENLAPDYLYLCAEFGTYSPLRVLAGLRAENQAHHWGDPHSRSTQRAKRRLVELFCPASADWRRRVVEHGVDLIDRAIADLRRVDP